MAVGLSSGVRAAVGLEEGEGAATQATSSVFWRDPCPGLQDSRMDRSHFPLQPVGRVRAGLVSGPGSPCLPWGVLSEQSLSVVLPAQLFPGRPPVRKLLEMLQEWLASLPLDRIPYDAVLDLVNNKMRVRRPLCRGRSVRGPLTAPRHWSAVPGVHDDLPLLPRLRSGSAN